jgi:restriction system protein
LAKQNLFNVLKDSPWWMSAVVAGAVFLGSRYFLPDFGAFFAALPFIIIAVYAGWRQLRTPGSARVSEALELMRAMPWEEFSALLAEAFRRDGYDVAPATGAADFALRKDGRVALASCRRWKVAQAGIGPLRELLQALKKQGADDALFVTAGELSPKALDFAVDNAIRVVSDVELVQLVRRVKRIPARKRA